MKLSSPRRRGPIRRVVAGCQAMQLSSDEAAQIAPFEIPFFDQSHFPVAIPFLQLLLAANGIFRIFVGLDINEAMNFVSLYEF